MARRDVAILGCGYVGLELGRQLDESRDVVGVRRSPDGIGAIESAGFEGIRADLTEPAHRAELPDADVVVYAASASGGTDARMIYTAALEGVIRAYGGRAEPPERFVYTSSTGVYGDHDGDWVDEETTIEPASERQGILLEAERLALETTAEYGIDGTVTRFGGLYGPERYRLSRYLEGPVTEGWLNLVHRDDAAGAVAHLIERGAGGDEVLNVVDTEPLDKWAFADWLAEACGTDPPPKQTVAERLEGDLSPAAAHRIRANKRCSSERLESLGYEFAYPTAREGYRPAIEAYRAEAAGE